MNKDILEKFSSLLSSIDDEALTSYKNSLNLCIDYVNNAIKKREDLSALVGGNHFEMVAMNHANHADFMSSIFVTKDVQILHDTYIWAYKTYNAKGFDFRYFYLELRAWIESFELQNNKSLTPVIELYSYLLSIHDYFVQQAASRIDEVPENFDEATYNSFLESLLKPDLKEALAISYAFIKKENDIALFWEFIILPSLYSIGNKWASAEISVGEEHVATSICQRVMAEHYPKIVKCIDGTKKILVTTSPNELHEVGARMLADMLELNGYDVTFLSSNSTTQEKLELIETQELEYVLISTTLVSNIIKTQEIVASIRDTFKEKSPVIIVGGQAFTQKSDAKALVQADYLIHNMNDLLDCLK